MGEIFKDLELNGDEKITFKVLTDEGKELECEPLFVFDSDETNNSYLVYTDNSIDENGDVKVYAGIYDKNASGISLTPITSEKEWKMVEVVLQEAQAESERIKESSGQ